MTAGLFEILGLCTFQALSLFYPQIARIFAEKIGANLRNLRTHL